MRCQDGEILANNRELLQDAIPNGFIQHLPGFYVEYLPEWPDFIALVEASRKRGDLDQRRDLYVRAPITEEDANTVMRKANKYSLLLGRLFDELDVNLGSAYITFATGDEDWPMHADPKNSIFVLCEGSVTWSFEGHEDVTLQKGDAIYFPGGTMHKVVAHEPRAAFMITLEEVD